MISEKHMRGCTAGIDCISAEHLLLAKDSKVTDYLVTLFSLCINYGIVPETFAPGLLIPLLKKPNSDPSVASNCRPVVISVTFAKLFEIYMLDRCGEYEFHDLQLGFVPG